MQNYKKVTYLISALAITGFVVFLIFRGKKEKPDLNRGERPVSKRVIVPREACSIPAEALRPFSNHLDASGIKTLMTTEYSEDIPLVEISFMIRDHDTKVKPFKVVSVGLSRSSGSWGGDYTVGGIGLRMGVGKDRSNLRSLLLGEEYIIRSFWLPGREDAISTAHLQPKFKIPETLGKNEVYKVSLLLKDELLEERLLAEQKAEAERKKRIEKEETITIRIKDFPKYSSQGRWIAAYHNGRRGRESTERDSEGDIIIKGPNKLGGELAVVFYSFAERTTRLWVYLKNVRKRVINFPADADLEVKDDDLIQVYLAFKDEDLLKEFAIIAFYREKNGRLPLFRTRLNSKHSGRKELEYKKIGLKVVPGSYHVRMIGNKGQKVILGKIQIAEEEFRTYTIHLPTEK